MDVTTAIRAPDWMEGRGNSRGRSKGGAREEQGRSKGGAREKRGHDNFTTFMTLISSTRCEGAPKHFPQALFSF